MRKLVEYFADCLVDWHEETTHKISGRGTLRLQNTAS
jgi:hypothetical protein